MVVRHKKKLYYQESDSEERREPEVTPVPLEGAFVAFTKNGVLQVLRSDSSTLLILPTLGANA